MPQDGAEQAFPVASIDALAFDQQADPSRSSPRHGDKPTSRLARSRFDHAQPPLVDLDQLGTIGPRPIL
jgi:hypothetical protein